MKAKLLLPPNLRTVQFLGCNILKMEIRICHLKAIKLLMLLISLPTATGCGTEIKADVLGGNDFCMNSLLSLGSASPQLVSASLLPCSL